MPFGIRGTYAFSVYFISDADHQVRTNYNIESYYFQPVHHSGGWCERNVSYGHQTDVQLANAFANFLIGKKVGSFGDGPGHYKNIIDKSSLVQLYDGKF